MIPFLVKIKTAFALGLGNILYVTYYRFKKMCRLNRAPGVCMKTLGLPFFIETTQNRPFVPTKDWGEKALYFGWWQRNISYLPPQWHVNPMNGKASLANNTAWWKIRDFDIEIGDIKLIWEASRFNWALAFTERYLAGDKNALCQLNDWIADWCVKNPPFMGVNWKCGQEAGIRVLHIAMTALLLNQVEHSTESLLNFIILHMKRIASTLRYAISQDNNHATSEAAALFIGGSWLSYHGVVEGIKWGKLGRKWLEKGVARLIETDGSFSQYSINYHRVMLDTLSMVEIWRIKLNLLSFSFHWQCKAVAATAWLANMVDPGANDSAYLFPLGLLDTRDFRTSVQTATVLFQHARAYQLDGVWNARIKALGLPLPEKVIEARNSQIYDQGGYAILRVGSAMAVLRYPRFHFRPSQADLLHVDLWHAGENVLRDAGSYSYHGTAEELAYFPGTASHNTVQFDDRDQMPRLGRFLFGSWLKTKYIETEKINKGSFTAAYSDRYGAFHKRRMVLSETLLSVYDEISGFKQQAILRWRLLPVVWRLVGNQLVSERGRITITATMPISKMALVKGWESRYYLYKREVPILEVEVSQSGELMTTYEWFI
jgi:hypothetical protein